MLASLTSGQGSIASIGPFYAEGENYSQLNEDIEATTLTYLAEKSDSGTDDLLDMASILDVCFKTTYIKNEKVDGIKARAVEEIKSMLTEQQGAAAAEPELKRKKTGQLFQKAELQQHSWEQNTFLRWGDC